MTNRYREISLTVVVDPARDFIGNISQGSFFCFQKLSHPSIEPPIHPFVHKSSNQSIHRSINPSVHVSIHPFTCLASMHTSVHQSITPLIHQSMHSSIHICFSRCSGSSIKFLKTRHYCVCIALDQPSSKAPNEIYRVTTATCSNTKSIHPSIHLIWMFLTCHFSFSFTET